MVSTPHARLIEVDKRLTGVPLIQVDFATDDRVLRVPLAHHRGLAREVCKLCQLCARLVWPWFAVEGSQETIDFDEKDGCGGRI
jgi:hypothetical protein